MEHDDYDIECACGPLYQPDKRLFLLRSWAGMQAWKRRPSLVAHLCRRCRGIILQPVSLAEASLLMSMERLFRAGPCCTYRGRGGRPRYTCERALARSLADRRRVIGGVP